MPETPEMRSVSPKASKKAMCPEDMQTTRSTGARTTVPSNAAGASALPRRTSRCCSMSDAPCHGLRTVMSVGASEAALWSASDRLSAASPRMSNPVA